MNERSWYIDFAGSTFEGEVGPFDTREDADEFARNLALQGGSASWNVIPLTRPEELL